ncbi:hypothetical protein L596_029752 [Steinernema carpocapsae]|uniref:Uncharacterized protein n=1 Tax=Steinernema carpocapsae TaxID=34508 RepID=A0A4U5LQQ5_STECR|nr:hypothetical protein L596_029752 [Steinernema carpocapsae]
MTAFSFRKWSLKRKLPATTAAFIVTTVLFVLVILKYSSKRSSANRCTEKEAEMRRTIGTELVDKFYDFNTCIYIFLNVDLLVLEPALAYDERLFEGYEAVGCEFGSV